MVDRSVELRNVQSATPVYEKAYRNLFPVVGEKFAVETIQKNFVEVLCNVVGRCRKEGHGISSL